MMPRFPMSRYARCAAIVGVCLSLVSISDIDAATKTKTIATKKKKKSITKRLVVDPAAETVYLFDGMAKGLLEVRMIPKDSKKGSLFIENKTEKPLTVKMPEAFVGVQVLKQRGGGGRGGGGRGGGRGGGAAQSTGGGTSGGGGSGRGGGGGGGGNNSFFSVPPEKIVRVPYSSVCLEHGKREPKPTMEYRIVEVDQYSTDPVLKELLKLVANRKIDSQAAQAAVWHLSSNMSWEELANKRLGSMGTNARTPYFSSAQVFQARNVLSAVVGRVRELESEEKDAESKPVRTRLRKGKS